MLFSNFSSFSVLFLAFAALLAQSPASALPHQARELLERAPIAAPEQWTNAKRLAAGLPPLAPRVVNRATPTEPNVGKRSVPSASPSPLAHSNSRVTHEPTTYTGHIEVRTVPDDVSLGFVRLSASGVSLGTESDTAATVSFTSPGTNAPFNIATTDSETSAIANFGALGNVKLASGSSSAVTIGSAKLTSLHARPAATGGETAIWSIDASTLELTALWVNPDGAHAHTTPAFSTTDSALVLTGDLGAYNAAHSDAPAHEVGLYLVRA